MIQIHVLGRSPAESLGIFGAIDLQRVQFLWSAWAVLAMLLLVSRFPRNPWLWLLVVIGAMDATEHLPHSWAARRWSAASCNSC